MPIRITVAMRISWSCWTRIRHALNWKRATGLIIKFFRGGRRRNRPWFDGDVLRGPTKSHSRSGCPLAAPGRQRRGVGLDCRAAREAPRVAHGHESVGAAYHGPARSQRRHMLLRVTRAPSRRRAAGASDPATREHTWTGVIQTFAVASQARPRCRLVQTGCASGSCVAHTSSMYSVSRSCSG